MSLTQVLLSRLSSQIARLSRFCQPYLECLDEVGVEVCPYVALPAGGEGEGPPAGRRCRGVEEAERRARLGQEDRGEANAVLLGVGQDSVLVRQTQGSGRIKDLNKVTKIRREVVPSGQNVKPNKLQKMQEGRWMFLQ